MRATIAILLGLAVLTTGCDRREAEAPQPDPAAAKTAANGAEAAENGRVDRTHAGGDAPDYRFTTPDGATTTLAAWRGKPVLVNLWATWCAPCVREMPTLDALAAREGDALAVLAISQDLEADKVAPFLRERGLTRIGAHHDPDLAFSVGLGVNLPTTILYDAQGQEVWRVTGTLDWAGEEAAALIAEAG